MVNAGSTSLKLRLVAANEVVSVIDELDSLDASSVVAVGHRVVHGGERLYQPVVIDESVRAEIGALESIAPLHNAPALAGIERAMQAVPHVPHVAVFDTSFHRTMPEEATTYALPQAWRETWNIRRFGFHGLSVAWSAERAPELLGVSRDEVKLVVCHLGGGASVTCGSEWPVRGHDDGIHAARRRPDGDPLGLRRPGSAALRPTQARPVARRARQDLERGLRVEGDLRHDR